MMDNVALFMTFVQYMMNHDVCPMKDDVTLIVTFVLYMMNIEDCSMKDNATLLVTFVQYMMNFEVCPINDTVKCMPFVQQLIYVQTLFNQSYCAIVVPLLYLYQNDLINTILLTLRQ